MTEKKTTNKILAKHIRKDGSLSVKNYVWHIPVALREKFEVGDIVMVDSNGNLSPVKVIELFREEFEPGVNDYKMVRQTRSKNMKKNKSRDWETPKKEN